MRGCPSVNHGVGNLRKCGGEFPFDIVCLCAAKFRLQLAALPDALTYDIVFGCEVDETRARRGGETLATRR